MRITVPGVYPFLCGCTQKPDTVKLLLLFPSHTLLAGKQWNREGLAALAASCWLLIVFLLFDILCAKEIHIYRMVRFEKTVEAICP